TCLSCFLPFFLFFSLLLPPPTSTLFPYTTLFRSRVRRPDTSGRAAGSPCPPPRSWGRATRTRTVRTWSARPGALRPFRQFVSVRSEEHTSELQSRFDLVCRLLLEKKKNIKRCTAH